MYATMVATEEQDGVSSIQHVNATDLWREPQRRRLVRLCAAVSGDPRAAEDLAQETLLEAWRNVHKLHDPAGADRWLAAIARNVCLRWARRRGRDAVVLPLEEPAAQARALAVEPEPEPERAELVELLDAALALLPPTTREVLLHRYVDDATHAEIAARLGVSEDAVSMRLSRAKRLLRGLLASEAAGDAEEGAWRETRIWCGECGRSRLAARQEPAPGAISFRCPTCAGEAPGAEFRLGNPFFARLVGHLVRPTAILARVADWSSQYYAEGAETGRVACTRCGRAVELRRYFLDRDERPSHGLFAECDACGEVVSSSARGLAQSLHEVRRFRREHARTRALAEREVEHEGVPALVVRYEDLLGNAGVDVVLARDTLRVLKVAAG
jgi:RNA polymerase sigma factor (sigma-70 family)